MSASQSLPPTRPIERELFAFAQSAHAAGWIGAARLAQLQNIERSSPDLLFSPAPARPIVVGLFGGTGVGKSSLLNRIAGVNVSQTGVMRPTSRSVTLYVHDQVSLAELPADLPADRIAVRRHVDSTHRHVVWVDTPDLDSADEANRACTLAWLGHLDLLVYVASPERYRDDVGWRVLRDRQARHAWIFVMNRWDERGEGQDADWLRVLREAGFDDPLLIRTSCAEAAGRQTAGRDSDELPVLTDAVRALFDASGVERLALRRARLRNEELAAWLDDANRDIGDAGAWSAATRSAREQWPAAAETIRSAAAFGVEIAARRFATRQSPLGGVPEALLRLTGRVAPAPSPTADPPSVAEAREDAPAPATGSEDTAWAARLVWDGYSEEQIENFAQRSLMVLDRASLPTAAAEAVLDRFRTTAIAAARGEIERSLRAALATPGRAWQRAAIAVLKWLTRVLPIAAALWIAYAAVIGFHRGASGGGAYFGSEFLFSAGTLLLVAWGLPALLRYSLQPSIEDAARAGLRSGLELALSAVESTHTDVLASIEAQAANLMQSSAALRNSLRTFEANDHSPEPNKLAQRLIGRHASRSKSPNI
ncbi:MAG: GTPase [Phycisphaerae bacterium]|nr:GTPase [Phycisphaerae bacterium]